MSTFAPSEVLKRFEIDQARKKEERATADKKRLENAHTTMCERIHEQVDALLLPIRIGEGERAAMGYEACEAVSALENILRLLVEWNDLEPNGGVRYDVKLEFCGEQYDMGTMIKHNLLPDSVFIVELCRVDPLATPPSSPPRLPPHSEYM